MNPILQWALVATQAALAIRLAFRRRWLMAMYFGLSAVCTINFHPYSHSWWASQWASAERVRLFLRTLIMIQVVWPLPRLAIILGGLVAPAFAIWIRFPANTAFEMLVGERVLILSVIAVWMIAAGAGTLISGFIPSAEFVFWLAVVLCYAVPALTTPATGTEWTAITEASSSCLLLVLLVWLFWLSKLHAHDDRRRNSKTRKDR